MIFFIQEMVRIQFSPNYSIWWAIGPTLFAGFFFVMLVFRVIYGIFNKKKPNLQSFMLWLAFLAFLGFAGWNLAAGLFAGLAVLVIITLFGTIIRFAKGEKWIGLFLAFLMVGFTLLILMTTCGNVIQLTFPFVPRI